MRNAPLALIAGLLIALGACARQSGGADAASTVPPSQPAAPAAASTPAPTAAPAAAAETPAAPSAGESTDDNTAASGSNNALERIAQLPAAVQLPAGKWVAGTNYKPLVPAQPTQVGAGKVEVVEVFWYGCPHCYALEPFLHSWEKNKPSYIELIRVPVTWSAIHRVHARLFYTLEAMGKLDALHQKVFDEIHVMHHQLAGADEEESLAAQAAFARDNGLDVEEFKRTWKSFGVESKLQRADELVRRYKVEGVPLVVVNGKYVTDVGMAGSQTKLIDLITDLAASEKRR